MSGAAPVAALDARMRDQRRRLGLDAAERALGLGERLARRPAAARGPRASARSAASAVGLGRRRARPRPLRSAAPCSPSIAGAAGAGCRARRARRRPLASSARWRASALVGLARCARSCWPRRAAISASRSVSSASVALALGERRLGSAAGAAAALAWRSAIAALAASRPCSSSSRRARIAAVVGDHALLAGDVVAELGEAAVEFGEPLADARLLGVERLAGEADALQRRAGARRRHREARAGRAPATACVARRLGLRRRRARSARPVASPSAASASRERLGGAEPAEMQHRRLGLADLAGEVAVARRLARLALQRLELLLDLGDHVVEPGEILLGGAQPQLGLVAAVVQAGDAGRLLEQRAAVLRLGGDQLADAALADHRRRVRAGRGVGEEELHVAGAHVAAVDAVDRAGLALDAARDLEELGVVERRRAPCGRRCRRRAITSAVLRAGRLPLPEKITSSMPEARMFLYELSPITQRSASTRLDLPQPFGPTTPVRPGSIRNSVGSTKDLKPRTRSRVNFNAPAPRAQAPARCAGRGPVGDSALAAENLVDFLKRLLAATASRR